jgi:aspartyl-tRNA(Asn)/glutamyl-tRNA(Gln) amidotransferase subunit C
MTQETNDHAAHVAHLSDLARLAVSDEELPRYEREFQDILSYVSKISSVPVTAVPAATTVSGVKHVLREDAVAPSVFADALLAAAPERRGRLVRVPAVF